MSQIADRIKYKEGQAENLKLWIKSLEEEIARNTRRLNHHKSELKRIQRDIHKMLFP